MKGRIEKALEQFMKIVKSVCNHILGNDLDPDYAWIKVIQSNSVVLQGLARLIKRLVEHKLVSSPLYPIIIIHCK